MGLYDHFAARKRNPYGVRIKLAQAQHIFELGCGGLAANPTVLEYGPGDGYMAELARKADMPYSGIEGSVEVSQKLKTAGYNVLHHVVPPVPTDLGQFDICFMLHIIEHLNGMQAASQLLDATRKHLSARGRIVIATPDYARWKADFYDCDYTHNLPFTQRRLQSLLVNTGFNIRFQTSYAGPVFGGWSSALSALAHLTYWKSMDRAFNLAGGTDWWYRGYLTFLPSLLVVAEKSDGSA